MCFCPDKHESSCIPSAPFFTVWWSFLAAVGKIPGQMGSEEEGEEVMKITWQAERKTARAAEELKQEGAKIKKEVRVKH